MSHAIIPRLTQSAHVGAQRLARPSLAAISRCNTPGAGRSQSNSVQKPVTASTSVGNVETPGFKPRPQRSGAFRVGSIFTVLIAAALGATGYAIYDYYTSFSAWPPELQDNLRLAIKSRNRGDVRRAETNFREALDKARQCKDLLNQASPVDGSGSGEAMLKISGIAIAFAAMLEDEGRATEAYDVLEDAWQEIMLQGPYQKSSRGEKRTQRDNMRAVSIASKLGFLGQIPEVRAEVLGRRRDASARVSLTGTPDSQDPAERYLVWSVEELFRIMLPQDIRQKALDAAAVASADSTKTSQLGLNSAAAQQSEVPQPSQSEQISLAELELPPWVSKLDILATVESLGTFYSINQVPEYAVPLYLQALSILLPKDGSPTVSERCKAALVMNNISQLMSVTNVEGASKWAVKGLGYVEDTLAKAGLDGSSASVPRASTVVQSSDERTQEVKMECLGVRLTLLYNLGVLSDVSDTSLSELCVSRTDKVLVNDRWRGTSVKRGNTFKKHTSSRNRLVSQLPKPARPTVSPDSSEEGRNLFSERHAAHAVSKLSRRFAKEKLFYIPVCVIR